MKINIANKDTYVNGLHDLSNLQKYVASIKRHYPPKFYIRSNQVDSISAATTHQIV